jgi:beta-lactamase regulating signal transducer with metallopeptidase domain
MPMMNAFHLQSFAEMLAGRLLNGLVEGLVIAIFAGLVLRVIGKGKQNSGTRFAVWFSALLATAVLSLAGGWSSGNALAGPANSAHSAITLSSQWAVGFFTVWALIAGVALIRVGAGLWGLSRLRQSCIAVDIAALDPLLRAAFEVFRSARKIGLFRSSRIQVPTAVGFFKPMVVLPEWALQELSTAQLHAVLVHEMAHLHRWDDWTNLIQKALRAVLFFHPAVWWIDNRLSLEREMACDDVVLALTENPRSYAQCLITVAEKSFLRRGVALAQAAVQHVRQTSLRISQILDVHRPAATRVWKPVLGLMTGFSVVCLVSTSHLPRLLAFQQQTTQVASVSQSALAIGSPHPVLAAIPEQTAALGGMQIADGIGSRAQATRKAPAWRASFSHKEQTPPVAQAQWREPNNLALTKAGANEQTLPRPQALPAVLVVVESERLGDVGPTFWSVRVFQFTVYHPAKHQAVNENPRKSL